MLSELTVALTLAAGPSLNVERIQALVALPPPAASETVSAQAEPAPADASGLSAALSQAASPQESSAGASLDAIVGSGRRDTAGSSLGWVLGLGILAGAALLFAMRGRKGFLPRTMRVVEQTPIGKGRSLILVDVSGQSYLLASSEAGVSLIGAPPQGDDAVKLPPQAAKANPPAGLQNFDRAEPLSITHEEGLFAGLQRLAGLRAGTPPRTQGPSFQDELNSCMEDVELRQKLAAANRRGVDEPH